MFVISYKQTFFIMITIMMWSFQRREENKLKCVYALQLLSITFSIRGRMLSNPIENMRVLLYCLSFYGLFTEIWIAAIEMMWRTNVCYEIAHLYPHIILYEDLHILLFKNELWCIGSSMYFLQTHTF